MTKGAVLTFDGVPFVIIGSMVLECQHGRDRYASRKKKQADHEVSLRLSAVLS